MIVCQENVDYEKHIKITFGTYALANNEPKLMKTNAPRRLECIYLWAIDRARGGHEILHLRTNSIITRNYVTPDPITPTIINQVHPISDREGMHMELKNLQ